MYKIAYGINYVCLVINPKSSADVIINKMSQYSGVNIENIVVCILDRPRHKDLIALVRKTGARIKLISDGDVSAVIATTMEDSGVDIYLGAGGSHEGVLAAAALRCLGGTIYGKLLFSNENEKSENIMPFPVYTKPNTDADSQ